MEKSYELQCLDYACLKTMAKGADYNTLGHISNAIKKLILEGYTKGFTSNDGARGYIENLDADVIEKELLINLVKKTSYDMQNGVSSVLAVNKSFDDPNLSMDEANFLIYQSLNTGGGMETVKYLLNKYENLYSCLSSSFAKSRYFDKENYNRDKLDKVSLNDRDKLLIDRIQSFYTEQFEDERTSRI